MNFLRFAPVERKMFFGQTLSALKKRLQGFSNKYK